MTFAALLPAAISAAGSIAGGYLSGRGAAGKETKMQRTKRKLVDKLISSLNGEGEFSNLFNMDEEAFKKSFIDPAKSMFNNQIAPQIQQQYIASGQQRGTGLDDQLLRAGVDLDSMINQYYYQAQQDAMNRKQNTINNIINGDNGAPNDTTGAQDLASGAAGYLSSDSFTDTVSNFFKDQPKTTASTTFPNAYTARKGYENDWMDYNLNNSQWGK